MASPIDLSQHEISVRNVIRNAAAARLYEDGVKYDCAVIAASAAMISSSGAKTGRSPKDKRVVDHPDSHENIWWGDVNVPIEEQTFVINRQRAIDYLNTRERAYVVDGFAGWDPKCRLKVRIICARAYHALFMHNMLIRPTAQELADFGEPDYVVYNAGEFPANTFTPGVASQTSISLSFERKEFVILGTQYAGEMKKGVFTLHELSAMPKAGCAVDALLRHRRSRHRRRVAVLFGLSGTGKTTLSADPERTLIGDDEHCWSDDGVFNIEGGCYAKMHQSDARRRSPKSTRPR